MLGGLYEQQFTPDAAAHAYEQALALQRDATTRTALARVYRALGRTAAADSLQATASTMATASVDDLLAQARDMLERQERAAAHDEVAPLLREVLARNPDHPEATGLLGDVLYAAGSYAEAADLLVQALEANPRSQTRWAHAARAYLETGHPDRALAIAEEGALLFPGQPALLELLGDAHAEQGRIPAARDYWQQALDLAPERDALREKLDRLQN
jgi:tetratricopeptide (TPR) repeat protein